MLFLLSFSFYLFSAVVVYSAEPYLGVVTVGNTSVNYNVDTNILLTNATSSNGGMIPAKKLSNGTVERFEGAADFPARGAAASNLKLKFYQQGGLQNEEQISKFWFVTDNPQIVSEGSVDRVYAVRVEVSYHKPALSNRYEYRIVASGDYVVFDQKGNFDVINHGSRTSIDESSMETFLDRIKADNALTNPELFPIDDTKIATFGAVNIDNVEETPILGDVDATEGKCGGTPSSREIINWIPCFLAELSYRLFYGLMKWPLDS